MVKKQKRPYNSLARNKQAAETRERILTAAKNLFKLEGFECVTIEKIARIANVSIPTIYSLFQSKLGVLRALIDEAFPPNQFDALVQKSKQEKSPDRRLRISAKIGRQIYDAERAQMEIFRGAAVLSPELKELEKEREMRRYRRQEITIQAMAREKSLAKCLKIDEARQILWALTGRDLYRLLVIEQGWTSKKYEKWIAQLLIKALVN